MKTKFNYILSFFSLALLLVVLTACEREIDEFQPATFPSIAEVFIDDFSPGLEYAAFGNTDVTAFEVDRDITYQGEASMRIEVPAPEAPEGAFAGGAYFVEGGRDLSSFNVLTFWARASKSALINEVGFGNYLGANENVVILNNIAVNTNWKKYYIPIPDPSILTAERGMFNYAEGHEDNEGYTIWFDEVQFEDLGTVTRMRPSIFNGEDQTQTAETGATFMASGTVTFNLPNGLDQSITASNTYFNYTSSDPSIAVVNENGQITVLDAGTATITATIGEVEAQGSLTINSTGEVVLPATPAPTPMVPAEDVISIYSNVYPNEPLDFINGFWEGSDTQSEEVQVNGDDIIRYTQLNFVGIQFTSPTIDISNMNRVHLDIWTPDGTGPGSEFKVLLEDLGADGTFDQPNNNHEVTIPASNLETGEWVSIDLPLTDFPGLTTRSNLALVVLSGTLPNVFVDNIYFYDDGTGSGGGDDMPEMAAPTPPTRAAGDVISLFSEAYDDVLVDTWRADFSQAVFEDVMIDGNATKKYSALDFAGVEFTSNQLNVTGMTHFHIDMWTPNATEFNFKLVDFGPNGMFEGPFVEDDTEHQIDNINPAQGEWVSYDLPLTDFVGLTNLTNLAQLILVGRPLAASTVFVDNVYFYNDETMSGGDEPTMAAPAPPARAAEDVISLFSDAYDDVAVDTWRTEWSMADFEDVMVAGNATKKYSNLDFVGITTEMTTIDASGMTHFHIDVWTPNATEFNFKIVDFGPNGVFEGPFVEDDTEHQINNLAPPQGQWISYDVPLSDFEGLTNRTNLAQYILVGRPELASTAFVDNIYFYSE
ncbi:MAG: Ig-like domain-containing protein [Bacteroidota bacterium]